MSKFWIIKNTLVFLWGWGCGVESEVGSHAGRHWDWYIAKDLNLELLVLLPPSF